MNKFGQLWTSLDKFGQYKHEPISVKGFEKLSQKKNIGFEFKSFTCSARGQRSLNKPNPISFSSLKVPEDFNLILDKFGQV